MVELLKVFSNDNRLTRNIQKLHDLPQGDWPTNPPKPRQSHHRLTEAEATELIARYQSGEKAHQLAKAFNTNRNTVARILTDAGVRRLRSLTPAQIQEATRLYGEGWSCQRIGQHFDKDHGTIWLALTKAGITMRDTRGRERQ